MNQLPVHHPDTQALLGYVTYANGTWQAQTVFGYTIARTESKEEAEAILHTAGSAFLRGVWRYYDKQADDWFPCVIQEASEQRVTVVRTTEMGYQSPDTYKRVVLERPDEHILIKS